VEDHGSRYGKPTTPKRRWLAGAKKAIRVGRFGGHGLPIEVVEAAAMENLGIDRTKLDELMAASIS
jgi:hypothetical protein